MQNCLWGFIFFGGGIGNLNWEERIQCFPRWESGWRLEEEPEPPQSPSGGESLFAPDKLSRSYGKLGFSLREKENAAAFQPGLPGRPLTASFPHPTPRLSFLGLIGLII